MTLLFLLTHLLLVLQLLLAVDKGNGLISDPVLLGRVDGNCLPVIKAHLTNWEDIWDKNGKSGIAFL